MEYPNNYGPVTVQPNNSNPITIYVPGESEGFRLTYAESLYNIPGIFLKPSRGRERYNLYYGTIDNNEKLQISDVSRIFRSDRFLPILENMSAFLDYIVAKTPYYRKHQIYDIARINDPYLVIISILDFLSDNDRDVAYDYLLNTLPNTFININYEYDYDYAIPILLKFVYDVLKWLYGLPSLDISRFKERVSEIDKLLYRDELKGEIDEIFYPIKIPSD